MAQNYLPQLKAASQKKKNLSDLEILNVGETIWYTGAPIPSERGTISLRTSNCVLVIREKDVLDVNKEGDYFEVKVKLRTPVIVRTENIIEAGATECGCGEKEKEGIPSTMAQQIGTNHPSGMCLNFKDICVEYMSGGEIKKFCVTIPYYRRCDIVDAGPNKTPINAGP